jgi:hypothetical protein
MDPRNRDERVAGIPRDEDHEIAADAAAMGESGIRRSAGAGGPGMAGAPTGDRVGGRTAHAATTGETTNAQDIGDSVGPSAALMGSNGTAGSGLGRPSAAGVPTAGAETEANTGPTAAGMGRITGAPGVAGARATNRGGSAAGGGGGSNG